MKKTLHHIGLSLVALICLIPFLWMLSASFMAAGETGQFPPRFWPENFTTEHYRTLVDRLNLSRYFLNSVLISGAATLISLLVNSMAGYAFAKLKFRGKDGLFKVLMAALVIPGQVTMLPVFLMLKEMGFINTYWAILIPGMASIFGIFLIRQYALSIPDSLIEAARMDGATDFQVYWKVILPLCKPILITLAIFTFMGTWNDFLWPLIVLNDQEMYTLPIALANLMGEHVQDTELMMAGSVMTVLPVIILFIVLQKYYIQGIMMGGVKE